MSHSTPSPHSSMNTSDNQQQTEKRHRKPLIWVLLGVFGTFALIGLVFVITLLMGIDRGSKLSISKESTPLEPQHPQFAQTTIATPSAEAIQLNPNPAGTDMFAFQTDDGVITTGASFGKEPPREYREAAAVSGMENQQWLVICSSAEPNKKANTIKAFDIKLEAVDGQYATYIEKKYWLDTMKRAAGENQQKLEIIREAEKVNPEDGGFNPSEYPYNQGSAKCNWLLQSGDKTQAEPYKGNILATTISGEVIRIEQYYGYVK